MQHRLSVHRPAGITLGIGLSAFAATGAALDFGNMMNPNRWFGGDRGDDYYYYEYGHYRPGYGAGLPPGYPLPPPYGVAPHMMPGYTAPAPERNGAAPGPAPDAVGKSAPAANDTTKDAEIAALKRRIRQLESAQRDPRQPTATTDGTPTAWINPDQEGAPAGVPPPVWRGLSDPAPPAGPGSNAGDPAPPRFRPLDQN